MNNAQTQTAMTSANITLEQFAAAIDCKVWKGSRIYLNAYKGGKNSKTTVYIYMNDEGNLDVSCYVEARTRGAYDYAQKRKAEVIAQVREMIADVIAEMTSAIKQVAEVAQPAEATEATKWSADNADAVRAGKFKSWSSYQRQVIDTMIANGGIALMTATEMNAFDGGARVDTGLVYEVTIWMSSRNKRSVTLIPLQRTDDAVVADEPTPAERITFARKFQKWNAGFHGCDDVPAFPFERQVPNLDSYTHMTNVMEFYA